MFNVVVVGADLVAAELATMAATQQAKSRAIVAHYGALYMTRVKAAASGRPGPRVITGNYRRSINMELGSFAGGTVATVGTNAPQARRLEYGFVGTDSLGRRYHQSPFPHWEPSLERTINEMTAALAAAVDASTK